VGRIDVHHHAIVPEIAALMRAHGAPFVPTWSLARTWEVLERNDIEHALVSNPIPGAMLTDPAVAARFVTAVDEASADLVREHPAWFGLLAALPMPHIDAALEAIRYAYDVLGADGVVLIAQTGGRYLGDPAYDEVLAELDRRDALVLVHPMTLPGVPMAEPPPVLADFLLDTTRAAINLMLTGALDRYPRIRFVLAHAGGFLPYAASRVQLLGSQFYDLTADQFQAYLSRFHYDLALSAPAALPSLLAAVPASQVLFGTDWCAAPAGPVARCTDGLDAADLPDASRTLIDRDNARRLLPRLAARIRVASGR
jgi:predicted TIM-barrel fold metal-dependent hydrolase